MLVMVFFRVFIVSVMWLLQKWLLCRMCLLLVLISGLLLVLFSLVLISWCRNGRLFFSMLIMCGVQCSEQWFCRCCLLCGGCLLCRLLCRCVVMWFWFGCGLVVNRVLLKWCVLLLLVSMLNVVNCVVMWVRQLVCCQVRQVRLVIIVVLFMIVRFFFGCSFSGVMLIFVSILVVGCMWLLCSILCLLYSIVVMQDSGVRLLLVFIEFLVGIIGSILCCSSVVRFFSSGMLMLDMLCISDVRCVVSIVWVLIGFR